MKVVVCYIGAQYESECLAFESESPQVFLTGFVAALAAARAEAEIGIDAVRAWQSLRPDGGLQTQAAQDWFAQRPPLPPGDGHFRYHGHTWYAYDFEKLPDVYELNAWHDLFCLNKPGTASSD